MAENQDEKNLDELLEDIALEPENSSSDNNNSNELDDLLSELEEAPTDSNSNDTSSEAFEEIPLSASNDLQTEDQNAENEFVKESDVQDEKEYAVQKKQSKLQKILIGITIGLVVVIIIGLILYLTGFFDPEETKPEQKEQTPKQEITQKKKKPSIDEKDINVDRLNKKLNMLTKYEILEDEKKELNKSLEKERLYQEAKEQLAMERQAKIDKIKEIEAKKYEEQLLAQKREEAIIKEAEQKVEMQEPVAEPKDEIVEEAKVEEKVEPQEVIEKPEIKEEVIEEPIIEPVKEIIEEPKTIEITTNDEMIEEDEEAKVEKLFIKFIVINTNKKDIFKSDLDKILNLDDRVQLCRNEENRIEIFVGPFEDNERNMVLNKFKENLEDENPEALDFTQEEFDKRCNY